MKNIKLYLQKNESQGSNKNLNVTYQFQRDVIIISLFFVKIIYVDFFEPIKTRRCGYIKKN